MTLGIMDVDAPALLLSIAVYGVMVHIPLAIALRLAVRRGEPIFSKIFAPAFLGNSLLMRVKFFWPLVPAPAELSERSLLTRFLFLGARLAGTVFAFGYSGFLLSVIYIGVHNA